MSRICRLFAGQRPNGTFDVVISRPGHDARTVDPLDPTKASFAASRGANPCIGEVVAIPSLNTWVNFTRTYADIPKPILAIKRAGNFVYLPFGNAQDLLPGGSVTTNRRGSLYVPVMEAARMMVSVPIATGTMPVAMPAGDAFVCFLMVAG